MRRDQCPLCGKRYKAHKTAIDGFSERESGMFSHLYECHYKSSTGVSCPACGSKGQPGKEISHLSRHLCSLTKEEARRHLVTAALRQ